MVVSIAIGALVMIGNNVFADFSSSNSGLSLQSSYDNRSVSCAAGGCGSSACALGGQVNAWVIGMGFQVSISCYNGYHACCNVGSASCLPPSACPDLNDSN